MLTTVSLRLMVCCGDHGIAPPCAVDAAGVRRLRMVQQGASTYFHGQVPVAAHTPPAGLGGAGARHHVLRAERFCALPAVAFRKAAIVWAFPARTLLPHLSSLYCRDGTCGARERVYRRSCSAERQRLFQRTR